MRRRDFLALAASTVAAGALPAALTAPAHGEGWRDIYAADMHHTQEPSVTHVQAAVNAMQRYMDRNGCTEIRAFRHEVQSDVEGEYLHVWTASVR